MELTYPIFRHRGQKCFSIKAMIITRYKDIVDVEQEFAIGF